MSEDKTDIKEIDFNAPKKEDLQTLVYRFLSNDRSHRNVDSATLIKGAISQYMNYGFSVSELVSLIMNDHRTIQQKNMGFVFRMIAQAAKEYKAGWFDGRNEYSYKLASKIYDNLSGKKEKMTQEIVSFFKDSMKYDKKKNVYYCDASVYDNLLYRYEEEMAKTDADGKDGEYHPLFLGCPFI